MLTRSSKRIFNPTKLFQSGFVRKQVKGGGGKEGGGEVGGVGTQIYSAPGSNGPMGVIITHSTL